MTDFRSCTRQCKHEILAESVWEALLTSAATTMKVKWLLGASQLARWRALYIQSVQGDGGDDELCSFSVPAAAQLAVYVFCGCFSGLCAGPF